MGGNKKTDEIRFRISKQDKQRIDRLTKHFDMNVSQLIRNLIWKADQQLENNNG